MAIVYDIINTKGGVGKTETALNMAYGLSKAGFKTLIVLLDPQANGQSILMKDDTELTEQDAILVRKAYDNSTEKTGILKTYNALASNGYRKEKKYKVDINEVLKQPIRVKEAIYHTYYDNLDIIPASDELSMTDGYLKLSGKNPSGRLRTALSYIDKDYDVIIIDNSPFESSLTYNGICSCCKENDTILIPVTISDRTIKGLGATLEILLEWIEEETLSYQYKILITLKQRTKLTAEWIKTLRHIFPDKVFLQEIRYQNNPVEKAALNSHILLEDKKCSNVQLDYQMFINEVIEDIRAKLQKNN